jgi:hypothetical protein
MILSEEGVRKIIREAFKVSDSRGLYKSTDRRFKCTLDNLRNASDESVVGKVLFFLNRALYFNPVGVSKKPFLEKLDRFLTTGMTLTPLENEQYNQSIKAQLKNSDFKKTLIDKIETTIDFMFFPSASGVCKIINNAFPTVAGPEKQGVLRADGFVEVIESSSRLMMEIFGLREQLGQSPYIQIFYPSTYFAISKGADTDDIERERSIEFTNLKRQILDQESLTVDKMWREIKRIHTGIGVKSRDKRIFLRDLEQFFESAVQQGAGESVTMARQLRLEIAEMIRRAEHRP